MKKVIVVISAATLLVAGVGCQNAKTKAVEGAVIGGVVGAGAGGIIGHQMHRGGEGAGIGAAVGAIAGGLIGGQIEKKPAEAASTQTTTQAASVEKLTMGQVIELAKEGKGDSLIIEKIKSTNSKFELALADISYLKQSGVSQQVIDAMQGK